MAFGNVLGRSGVQIATGSYVGTCPSGSSASQTINVGFTPDYVEVFYYLSNNYKLDESNPSFAATTDEPCKFYNQVIMQITDGGFIVTSTYRNVNGLQDSYGLNRSIYTYKYFAAKA